MLILAGVSINAIVGDNGIITNSQNANMKSGMAVLEEWLQEKYVEYYGESDNYINKLELLANKVPNLFLKDGSRNYITNGGKAYYVINKSSLPKELKDVLGGGNTTTYANYIRLYDVYGVTADLKVYYCDNSKGTILGDLDGVIISADTPLNLLNSDGALKSLIIDKLAESGVYIDEEKGITYGDVGGIKDLEIDGSKYNVTSLAALSDINVIKKLTLKNLNLANLNGIESNINLTYIYLDDCIIEDYSTLNSMYSLNKLYIHLPNEIEESVANQQVNNLGNGLSTASNLNALEYFGIFGYDRLKYEWSFIPSNGLSTSFSEIEKKLSCSNLTNIFGLSKFHATIKNSIKYLYLNNNNISSLAPLSNFKAPNLVCLGNSSLVSLNGVPSALQYLYAQFCGISDISVLQNCTNLLAFCIDNNTITSLSGISKCTGLVYLSAKNCLITDINSLGEIVSLKQVFLQNNSSLTNVNGIETWDNLILQNKTVGVERLYLAGCSSSMSANGIKNVLKKCGSYYSLPVGVKCLTAAKYNWKDYYSNETSNLYSKLYSDLYGNIDIKELDLMGLTVISNDNYNTILSSMTSVNKLILNGCSTISSDSWATSISSLNYLDIRGCSSLNLLTNLNNLCADDNCKLSSLFMDNSNIELSNYQTMLNRVCGNYNYGYNKGLIIQNATLAQKLSGCTTLTKLGCHGAWSGNTEIDLTKCKQLTLISGTFASGIVIKCPESLLTWGGENKATPDFSECKSLTSYTISYTGNTFSDVDMQKIINSMSNIQSSFKFNLSHSNNITGEIGLDFSPLSTSGVYSIRVRF